jgi:hypothetical protein
VRNWCIWLVDSFELFVSFVCLYESCVSETALLLQWPGYGLNDYASIPGSGRVLKLSVMPGPV